MPRWESVCRMRSHISRARASTSAGGHLHRRLRHRRVERRLAELALDAPLLDLEQAPADVLAQLRDGVEAGVDREVVVDLGQLLALDLLDGAPRSSRRGRRARCGRSRRGRSARACGSRRRAAPTQPLLEALDQVAGAELDQLIAPLPPSNGSARRPRRRASRRSRSRRSRPPAPGARRSPGARGDRAAGRSPAAPARRRRRARRGRPRGPGTRRARAFGQHADLEGELEVAARRRQLAERDLRVADRDDAGGSERVDVPAAEIFAHRLLEHGLATDALDDERRRAPCRVESPAASGCRPSSRALRSMRCSSSPAGTWTCDAHARLGQLGDGRREGARHGSGATIPCRPMRALRQRSRRRAAWRGGCGPVPSATSSGGLLDFRSAPCARRTPPLRRR